MIGETRVVKVVMDEKKENRKGVIGQLFYLFREQGSYAFRLLKVAGCRLQNSG